MRDIRLFSGSFLLILGLILAVLPLPAAAYGDCPLSVYDTEVAGALDYLRSSQTAQGDIGGFAVSGWVIMAIAAAGEDPHSWKTAGGNPSIVDYLEDHTGDTDLCKATDVERMILAIVAADGNPRDFGGVDFVTELEALYDGTQVGEAALLNDDFWAVLALVSAGESPGSEIITSSISFIKNNQNGDGGWSWGVNQSSDVDDTACAVMALIAAGESQNSSVVTNGLDYIKFQQADNGGFLSWGTTNPSTDSWAIDAIVAAGQDPTSQAWTNATSNNTPVDDLLSFQNATDGSFPDWSGNPSPWITSYALQALLSEPYPVKSLELEQLPVYVRVEGRNETVWNGEVIVSDSWITADNSNMTCHLADATALGALDEASKAGEFDYTVHYWEGLGLAITSIKGVGDWAAGPWWLYRVDYRVAKVGADSFILNETSPPAPPHQEALFYISTTWSELPLKISVDKIKITAGGTFTANVTQYDDANSSWIPCPNVTVHADKDYVAGLDGEAAIRISSAGNYQVFAEKDGCIRSDKVDVRVVADSCSRCGGGGGGRTSYYHGEASLFGMSIDYRVGRDGSVEDDIEAASEDGVVGIAIPEGTVVLDRQGSPVKALNFAVNETPPLPPEDACLVGQACDFSPRGATFNPPMTLNWSYTPESLPRYVAEESLAVGYFDTGNGSWVKLAGDVDTAAGKVTARIGHFTTFALIGEVVPPPASFSLSNLAIEPTQVAPGETVSISVLLSNTGGTEGNYTVVVDINGAAEAEKSLTLAAGQTERVTFSLAEPPGSYNVTVGELQDSFIVLAPPSWLSRWWWAIVAGVLLVGLLISFLGIRRRRV